MHWWSCRALAHGARHWCCCAALAGSMYFRPATLALHAGSDRCYSLIKACPSIALLSASEIAAAICTSVVWERVCSHEGSSARQFLSSAAGPIERLQPLAESCPRPGTATLSPLSKG